MKTDAEMCAMLQDVPEVLTAYEEYKKFCADPMMREKVRERERFLNAKRLDRAEAEERGETKGKITIAQNMKREGLDSALIARMTGLPVSEVERLN
jgi:predicted transposase/invertase (TIGR01784 family)